MYIDEYRLSKDLSDFPDTSKNQYIFIIYMLLQNWHYEFQWKVSLYFGLNMDRLSILYAGYPLDCNFLSFITDCILKLIQALS